MVITLEKIFYIRCLVESIQEWNSFVKLEVKDDVPWSAYFEAKQRAIDQGNPHT